jgi:hypothetical protein
VDGDVVERRELGDEPDKERRKLGEESLAWPETWSSGESSAMSLTRARRGVPSVARDVVERQELGDDPNEERQELDEESPVWPETWSSYESSATSLTRSNESSARSP